MRRRGDWEESEADNVGGKHRVCYRALQKNWRQGYCQRGARDRRFDFSRKLARIFVLQARPLLGGNMSCHTSGLCIVYFVFYHHYTEVQTFFTPFMRAHLNATNSLTVLPTSA